MLVCSKVPLSKLLTRTPRSHGAACFRFRDQPPRAVSSLSRTNILERNRARQSSSAAVPVAPGDIPPELQAHTVSADFDHIPIIDVGKAAQGAEARADLLSELRRATEEIGFGSGLGV